MQESAQAAHSWVRSHAVQLGLDPAWFEAHDVHVHIPAGAVPKDGPSAGITMATAIVSVVSGQPVSEEVAMTGEVTLSGQVLQIGGLREKALAAQRAGIKKVVMPRENEPELAELPEETRKELEFVPVDSVEEVLEVALNGTGRSRPPADLTRRRKAASGR
jgi:ATP-dependent Lon protease